MNPVDYQQFLAQHPYLLFLVAIIAIWSLPWKGFALWKAARNGDTRWFIALLLVNTAAILDILYIFVFSAKKPQKH